MAIWQYDIALVPRAAVVREHGEVPAELPGYRAIWNPEEALDDPSPNYWENSVAPESFSGEIEVLLPVCQSWSDNALMYGVEDGNSIQIWKREGITFRFDLRAPDLELLRSVVEFARRHDLLMVPDTQGHPFEPSLDDIIADIRTSDSYSFCKDPEAFLKRLKIDRS